MTAQHDREPIRQRWRAALCLGIVVAILAACGGGDQAPAAAPETAPGEQAASQAAYPVTLPHKFGDTTIEATPKRVVAVGLTDQDAVLALGTVPVGTREWFGDAKAGIWPWAEDLLDGQELPTVVGGRNDINFEQIALLRPDLILAVYSGLSQDDYDKLSQIAPTVAQPGDVIDWGVSWQEQATTIGAALGRSDEAHALVDEVEAKLDEVKAAHPEFAGANGIVVSPMSTTNAAIFTDKDPRGRFLTDLGFTHDPKIDEEAGDGYTLDIGLERLDLVNDVDVVVWLLGDVATNSKILESIPVYTASPVFQEGRGLYVDTDKGVGAATSFITVLSVPTLLDELAPRLSAALDGDPATPA